MCRFNLFRVSRRAGLLWFRFLSTQPPSEIHSKVQLLHEAKVLIGGYHAHKCRRNPKELPKEPT